MLKRAVARRWRRNWPQIRFERVAGSTKGTLVGRKLASDEELAFPSPATERLKIGWQRAAMIAGAFAIGWLAKDMSGRTEAARAETPAETLPLLDMDEGRVLSLAAMLAE